MKILHTFLIISASTLFLATHSVRASEIANLKSTIDQQKTQCNLAQIHPKIELFKKQAYTIINNVKWNISPADPSSKASKKDLRNLFDTTKINLPQNLLIDLNTEYGIFHRHLRHLISKSIDQMHAEKRKRHYAILN